MTKQEKILADKLQNDIKKLHEDVEKLKREITIEDYCLITDSPVEELGKETVNKFPFIRLDIQMYDFCGHHYASIFFNKETGGLPSDDDDDDDGVFLLCEDWIFNAYDLSSEDSISYYFAFVEDMLMSAPENIFIYHKDDPQQLLCANTKKIMEKQLKECLEDDDEHPEWWNTIHY